MENMNRLCIHKENPYIYKAYHIWTGHVLVSASLLSKSFEIKTNITCVRDREREWNEKKNSKNGLISFPKWNTMQF